MCRESRREDVIQVGRRPPGTGILLKSYKQGEIRDSITYMATGRT